MGWGTYVHMHTHEVTQDVSPAQSPLRYPTRSPAQPLLRYDDSCTYCFSLAPLQLWERNSFESWLSWNALTLGSGRGPSRSRSGRSSRAQGRRGTITHSVHMCPVTTAQSRYVGPESRMCPES